MATTLAEILPAAAARHADRTALVVGERRTCRSGELDAESNRVANGLVAIGVKPGDRVALFGANSCEWVVAYYGIAKTGAVLNPLSSMLTTDELRYTVTDAGARVVIGSSDKAGQLRELKAAGVARPYRAVGTRRGRRRDHAGRLAAPEQRRVRCPPAPAVGPGGDRLYVGHDRAARKARCRANAPSSPLPPVRR